MPAKHISVAAVLLIQCFVIFRLESLNHRQHSSSLQGGPLHKVCINFFPMHGCSLGDKRDTFDADCGMGVAHLRVGRVNMPQLGSKRFTLISLITIRIGTCSVCFSDTSCC